MLQESPKHSGEREALLKAVEHTDISFFSPLFDRAYDKLVSHHPGKTVEQIYSEAIEAIMEDPAIKRVGLKKILQSYQNKESAANNFSALTRKALDYFISKDK